jgi:hypothetical protein
MLKYPNYSFINAKPLASCGVVPFSSISALLNLKCLNIFLYFCLWALLPLAISSSLHDWIQEKNDITHLVMDPMDAEEDSEESKKEEDKDDKIPLELFSDFLKSEVFINSVHGLRIHYIRNLTCPPSPPPEIV